MNALFYAGTGVAIVLVVFFLLYSSIPAIRTPFLSDTEKLQNTPNNLLTDNQIISQTNTIPAVKGFVVKHPEPKIDVLRFDDHLVHVIYSNDTSTTGIKSNSIMTIESLEILLGESATYAQDSSSTSMIYHCRDNLGPC
jgi:hypothetical protein